MIKIFVVVALVLNFAAISRADEPANRDYPAAIESLLTQRSRPTVADIHKALNPWPAVSPVRGLAREQLEKFIKDGYPKFIAGLEFAYPGGTYAFLGRDSVWIADAVDAFYRAHGQPSRVIRLEASGASFPNRGRLRIAPAEMSPEQVQLILDFLSINGLRVDNVDANPPYVIIDRTGYRLESQSRVLLAVFYREYHRQTGRPFKDLVRKVNVVNTNARGGEDIKKAQDYFSSQHDKANGNGPTTILENPIGFIGHEWHDQFGPLQRAPDGRVSAEPGKANVRPVRLDVLANLIEIQNIVSTQEFYDAVIEAAKTQYGYDFPNLRRTAAARNRSCGETLTQPASKKAG